MVNAQKILCFRQCDGFGRRGRYNINCHLLTCFFCIGLFHRFFRALFWWFCDCLTKTSVQKIGQHLIGVDFHHRVFAVVESVTRYRFQKSDFPLIRLEPSVSLHGCQELLNPCARMLRNQLLTHPCSVRSNVPFEHHQQNEQRTC